MTDMLDRTDQSSSRGGGPLRQRTAKTEQDVPPALDAPKELYVAIRSMAGDDCFVANMWQPMARFFTTYGAESPRDKEEFYFEEVSGCWIIAAAAQFERPTRIRTTSRPSFLDNANRLDRHGQTDAALDIIFDQIDEMLLAGEFDRVDQVLKSIAPDNLSVELLLGLLTATLPAKNQLLNRATFFEQVRQSLHERGETDKRLLIGLD